MLTHDFRASVPAGTLRISVIACGDIYVTDVPAAKVESTLRVFQDFAGPDLSEDRCTAVADEADDVGDAHLVYIGALWLFLRMSNVGYEREMHRDRMLGSVKAGGRPMLTVTTDFDAAGWKFALYELPKKPVVPPYQTNRRDMRRRWR